MMSDLIVKVHEIARDGLPDMDDESLVGRVAFIFDGCIVSGWPLIPDRLDDPSIDIRQFHADGDTLWEGNEDVANGRPKANVTHWVEFPVPVWEIERKRGNADAGA